jgi:hypothetical protein
MESLQIVARFLNNQSVGAFLGAFAAFMLVVINDWRRDRRKVRNIRAEIVMNLLHAQAKLETVRRNRNALRQQNQVVPAPIMKFNTTILRQLVAETLDRVTGDQRLAVDAICYHMEATDGLLQEILALVTQLDGTLAQSDRVLPLDRLVVLYGDAIVNLKRIIEMCGNYRNKDYATIVTKQYNRLDYEEP